MKKKLLLFLSVVALALTACGSTTVATPTTKSADSTVVCTNAAKCESSACEQSCDKECEKGDACCKKTGKTCDTPCSGDKSCAEKTGDCDKKGNRK